jgi:protein phosphatase
MQGQALKIIGRTHPGLVRSRNEDAIGWRHDLRLAVLADGMGGLRAGDVASVEAVRSVLHEVGRRVLDGAGEHISSALLVEALRLANRRVWALHQNRPGATMGTTIVVAAFTEDGRCLIAHAGDSRAYRLRDAALQQLTVDHSLVQRQVEQGALTPEQARSAPDRNVITRALGLEADLPVEPLEFARQPGDLLLLCSDGLWEMLPEPVIAAELLRLAEGVLDPAACADALLEAANAAGGSDNISFVIMHA